MTFVPRQEDYESNPAYRLTDQDRIDLNLGYLGFPMQQGDIRRKIEDVIVRAIEADRSTRDRALSHARACLREIATANNGYLSIREVNDMLRSI